MALRSGRFKGENATPITIAAGRDGVLRVFNSGASAFTVSSSGSGISVPIPRDQCVDFPVAGSVTVAGADGTEWEGIYDYLQPGAEVRSGRFKGDANPAITIRKGGDDDSFYRVMNSGDYAFDVNAGGTKVVTLEPTFSIDLVADDVVTISRSDDQIVEGIFDIVYESSEVRSGRFRFRPEVDGMGNPVAISAYPHTIIDHREAGRPAWYRLFNSGEHAIIVKRVQGNTPVDLVTAEPQCSADFQLPGPKPQRLIKVTTADPKNPIEGSFDLLDDPSN